MGEEGAHDHQGSGGQQARQETGHEQLLNALVGQHGVDDQRCGGGNQRSDDAAGSGDAAGEAFVEAGILHALDLQLAQTAGISQSGAGHTGEDQRSQYVDVGQTALFVADHGSSEIKDTGGNAAAVHQVAREDKERNCQQRLAVDAVKHLFQRERHQIQAARNGEEEHGRRDEGVTNMHTQEDQDKP